MKELRILHCRQGDRVWGPERQILQLAERLPSYGISMEIVLLRRWGLDAAPHPLAVQARASGCTVFEVSARPREWPRVVHLLQERLRQCDLLHTHEFKSDLLGYPAARLSQRPWIATDHHLAEDDDFMLRAFGRADRWALRRAQAVVVPSRSQAERLAQHVSPERIHVIYHGIDAEAFARSAGHDRRRVRARYGVDETQPVVAIFGRLEPVKGHSDFLDAARLLLAQRPDIRFWIVGEGKLRQRLVQQTQTLGISHAVTFLGYQEDVAPLMEASDLILMPSHHESFGIVLIEAMSLAKPVVASSDRRYPRSGFGWKQWLSHAAGRLPAAQRARPANAEQSCGRGGFWSGRSRSVWVNYSRSIKWPNVWPVFTDRWKLKTLAAKPMPQRPEALPSPSP